MPSSPQLPEPDFNPRFYVSDNSVTRRGIVGQYEAILRGDTPTSDDIDEEDATEEREIRAELEIANRYRAQTCYACRNTPTEINAHQFIWSEATENIVCPACIERHCLTCFNCGRVDLNHAYQRVRTEDEDMHLCHTCDSEDRNDEITIECNGCGNTYRIQDPIMLDGIGNRCTRCVEQIKEQGEILMRSLRKDVKLTRANRGATIKSSRAFGIELETVLPTRKHGAALSYDLEAHIGLTSDGSIQRKTSNEVGLEIQTPPAAGEKAEALIRKVCETLKTYNSIVNVSCGYHIHIDMNDIDDLSAQDQLDAVKRVWMMYLVFEDVFLSFLPPSRQDNIRYCAALKSEYHLKEILYAKNMDELEGLWYRLKNKGEVNRAKQEHRHASRYRGINLHPLFSDRHIEIRYHSGTMLPEKILEWANLHTILIDRALSSNIAGTDWWIRTSNSIDVDYKTQVLFDMLDLPEKHRDYFLARQETFKKKTRAPKKSDAFKAGMQTLEAEKEQ